MPDHLHLQSLCIDVGTRRLVSDVSLRVDGGELVALVGASGSGKSLTARSLLGLVDLEPGVVSARLRIEVEGHTIEPYAGVLGKGRRRRDRAFRDVRGALVGYLPQDARSALDPLSRVGAQVRGAARLGGGDPDPLPWLRKANLPDPARVARLFPHELSGGMAQRVVIAQALARGSRFLLADEPTSALDPTVQASILAELRRLTEVGIGVLLITHDLRVLPHLADRLVIIHQGRIVERAQPSALIEDTLQSEAGTRLVAATRRVAGGVLG